MIGGNTDVAVKRSIRQRITRTEPIIGCAALFAPIAEMLLREKFHAHGFAWAVVLFGCSVATYLAIRADEKRADEKMKRTGFAIALHGFALGVSPLVVGLSKSDLVSRAIATAVFAFVVVVSALALAGERVWHFGRIVGLFSPLYVWAVTGGDWKFFFIVTLVLIVGVAIHESATRVAHGAIRTTLANEFLLRELEIANRRLSHDTTHDGLTGLGNRQLFSTQLEAAFCADENTTVAVSFVDVDNFKSINDTHGHDVGDAVLIEVADRMAQFCDESSVAARRSGDEFTVLHTFSDSTRSESDVAAALQRAIAGPMKFGDVTIQISCSVGTAFRTYSDSTSSVLRNADAALYEAKRTGRGRGVGFSTIDLSRVIVSPVPVR
jgi:diguanylate cyclase (GGDEF)-like protein